MKRPKLKESISPAVVFRRPSLPLIPGFILSTRPVRLSRKFAPAI